MVEYNASEKLIIMWAKCFENLAMWNAIAHDQPLLMSVQGESIKRFVLVFWQCFLNLKCVSVLTENNPSFMMFPSKLGNDVI